jgi:hypothetical protein
MKALERVFAVLVTAVLAAQDDAALHKAIREYESAKEAPARIRALEAIAALPADLPADKRTRALAKGLAAREPSIRLRAVQLVAEAPDRDIAIVSLVAACKEVRNHMRRTTSLVPTTPVGGMPDLFEEPQQFKKWSSRMAQFIEQMRAWGEAVDQELAAYRHLLTTLEGSKDARAVAGLLALMDYAGASEDATRAAKALLRFPTKETLAAVTRHIAVFEAAAKSGQKEVERIRGTKPEPMPKHWHGTKEEWNEKEWTRINLSASKAQTNVNTVERCAEGHVDCLAAFAREHKLADPPTTVSWSLWQPWLAGARLAFADPPSSDK